MFYDGVEVAGIKMAVSGIESLGISSKQVLLKSISYLRVDFEKFQEISYLKKQCGIFMHTWNWGIPIVMEKMISSPY